MSRDHRKLVVFSLADELITEIYAETASFPIEERYGLRSQVRRSSVSVATNLVEGCARRSTREYVQFVNLATGSAAETLYLLGLTKRLGLLAPEVHARLAPGYERLVKQLKQLLNSLERPDGCG